MDSTVRKIKNNFIIGDEWIYFKIYTGINIADHIVHDVFYTVTEKLKAGGHIDKWFFIRYTDPDFHLRFRLHIAPAGNFGTIVSEINLVLNQLFAEKVIWKLQMDTYEREVDRYGDSIIDEAENIFYHDSVMISKTLPLLQDDTTRWIFGLYCIDTFLDTFGYNLDGKKTFLAILKKDFQGEFKADMDLKKALSQKFRTYRNNIMDYANQQHGSKYEPLQLALKHRGLEIKHSVPAVLDYGRERLDEFMASYIHMTMNRLFRSNARRCELVVYDLLYNYYAMLHNTKKNIEPLTLVKQ